MEEGHLASSKWQEVAPPVEVEDGMAGQDHPLERRVRNGRCKVVAVVAHLHAQPRVQLDERGGAREGRVVARGGDGPRAEARRRERGDGQDGVFNPPSRERLDLNVDLGRPEEEADLVGASPSAATLPPAPPSARRPTHTEYD